MDKNTKSENEWNKGYPPDDNVDAWEVCFAPLQVWHRKKQQNHDKRNEY